jgi:hypothetical protein
MDVVLLPVFRPTAEQQHSISESLVILYHLIRPEISASLV